MAEASRQLNHRTITGCLTCRKRRVKCDDVHPTCGICRRLHLVCEGFEVRIRWLQPSTGSSFESWSVVDVENSPKGRRPLYSDAERRSMTLQMTSAIPSRNFKDTLASLEEQCPDNGIALSVGSLTVFRYNPIQNTFSSQSSTSLRSESLDSAEDVDIIDHTQDCDLTASRAQGDAGSPSSMATSDLGPDFNLEDFIYSASLGEFDPNRAFLEAPDPLLPYMMPIPDDFTPHIPPSVNWLLDHFQQHYVGTISLISNAKSPWHILHSPSALMTLGELVVWRHPNRFRLSLFYAILALSSFHLDRLSKTEVGTGQWWTIGQSHYNRAKAELQKGIAEEPNALQKSKYKDILMALLTMVTVCITSGEMADARAYLLEAQKHVELRGSRKPTKSRKVKALHSIFIFLRVIEESTFIYSQIKQRDPASIDWLQSSARYPSLGLHMQDYHQTSQMCAWDDLGESEIEKHGHSAFSMIYGMPESLLVLMSHITCLSNEMQFFKSHPHMRDSVSYQDLEQRCKVVEDLLCNWDFSSPSLSSSLSPMVATNDTPSSNSVDDLETTGAIENDLNGLGSQNVLVNHLVRAMHSALLIFFYKQVRDVNSFVLQSFVKDVKKHLIACESYKAENQISSSSLAWPGFIAASEAQDEGDFDELIAYMSDCGNRSGLRNFDQAAKVAVEIRTNEMKAKMCNSFGRVNVFQNMRIPLVCS